MKKQKCSHNDSASTDVVMKGCVGHACRSRQCRRKDPPVTVRSLLVEAHDTVYSIHELIKKLVLPALSTVQQECLLQKLRPFLSNSNCLTKASLTGRNICEPLSISTALFEHVQMLFRDTLLTSIHASPPSLTKVRQPVVPPSQSLVSLVHDIIWTLLQQQNKTLPDRTAGYSRSYIRHILCQGYTTGHPTATTTHLKVQKQINSAMEYCATSTFFRILHTILLGDDILRYILLNFNIFVPILPVADHPDKTDAMKCDSVSTLHSALTFRMKCSSNGSGKLYNYWQVSGIPFHFRSSTKEPRSKGIAISTTVLKSRRKQSHLVSENLIVPSKQPLVHTEGKNAASTELLNSTDEVKNTHKKRRRRPIAGLDPIYGKSESGPPASLSPKACLCRKALFYSNSFTNSIGTQGLFVMSSSSNAPTVSALMTPVQLWDSMTLEWKDFQCSLANSFQPPVSPLTLDLCADILHRHKKKTDYHRLLQRYCPLPVGYAGSTTVSLSELASQHSPPEGVIAFVQACLQSILPSSFWDGAAKCTSKQKILNGSGTDRLTNESVFLHQIVPLFVKLRRNERIGNKVLLQNVRITKMSWIKPDGEVRHKGGATRRDHESLKLQVLSVFRWLFHSYIIPLLQQCFYVTESEMHGKRVLYYRKPVWALFRTLSMSKLLGSSTKIDCHKEEGRETEGTTSCEIRRIQYVEVTEADVLRKLLHEDKQMGVCRLRLVPKATGVRPIATLNKREFITPVVPTSNSTTKSHQITLCEILDIGELDLNDDEEMDTPIGPARKKTRRDVMTDSAFSSSTLNDPPTSLPPTRIRLTNQSRVSTNMMLNDIFSVLTFEKDRKKLSFGSGLTGMHDFYPRYRSCIQHWTRNVVGTACQRLHLYFGSVDIRHCYDNIDQEHLLSIIGNVILTEDHYVIQKYSVYKPERHSDSPLTVKWQTRKDVSLLEQLEPFSSKVQILSNEQRRSIFVDGVNTIVINKEQIMNQLRVHLTGHMVVTKGRYGNRYLLQSTGIPQGSILSTILCNFYYGDVEGRLFESPLHKPSHSNIAGSRLMARMVDDFLLVTTNVDDLYQFFKTMHRGDSDLGVTINHEKTSSSIPVKIFLEDTTSIGKSPESFDILSNDQVDPSGSYFCWCGMMFDTRTGEVRIDYSRFVDGKGGDSLTVDRVSHEGNHLFLQMKQFVRPRCLPILYDPMINSAQGRIINFYQMMVYTAVKTSEYLKSLQHESIPSSSANYEKKRKNVALSNIPFLIRSIGNTIQFGSELIQVRVHTMSHNKNTSDLTPDATIPDELPRTTPVLPPTLTTWLGWRSFYDVFRVTRDFRTFAEAELSHRVSRLPCDHRMYSFNVEATVQQALEGMNLASLLSNYYRKRPR